MIIIISGRPGEGLKPGSGPRLVAKFLPGLEIKILAEAGDPVEP